VNQLLSRAPALDVFTVHFHPMGEFGKHQVFNVGINILNIGFTAIASSRHFESEMELKFWGAGFIPGAGCRKPPVRSNIEALRKPENRLKIGICDWEFGIFDFNWQRLDGIN
jgi:hypothetical protein